MAIKTDFLVIGSGMAGLIFALKASDYGEVVVVTKKKDTESNTNYAQGGIAAVFAKDDSIELHIQDTLKAGGGLCDERAVRVMVERGPRLVRELWNLGVDFSLDEKGEFSLGMEGGHSRRRIVHARDLTGKEIERVLVDSLKKKGGIILYEDHIAIDLIVSSSDGKECWGAYVLDTKSGVVKTLLGKATILATGGMGQVYLHTTNPSIATGDGVAMAYRAGATIANMEFVQFHPTSLFHPLAKSFLISESVRGEGGVLRLKDGSTFMEKYHERKSLAPRDIVGRAIDAELKKSGEPCVFLDLSSLDPYHIRNRFPHIYEKCLSYGIDITREWIPVVPAAHYCCGGVLTDLRGRTTLPRLYAIGETACTGVHGANRLASNSLLEALVFAELASEQAIAEARKTKPSLPQVPDWNYVGSVWSNEAVVVSHNQDEIKRLMWDYVGIVRSLKRLERAKKRMEILLNEIREYYWKYRVTPDLVELRNIATVADLVIQSSLVRKESRGLHYIIDYPETDDFHWKKNTILRREEKI